jgi:hypothetical protein
MEASRVGSAAPPRRTWAIPQHLRPAPKLTLAAAERGDYDLLLVAVLAALAAVLLIQLPGAFGVDSWLALTAGREVWQSGIPHHDTLTLLSHGSAWVDQQWLSQLATYATYRVGGLGLVGVVNVTLIMSGVAGAALAARRLGVGARTLILLLPGCAWLVLPSGEVRTQAFAFPLFVATFYVLASDSRKPSSRVYWSLPLLAVWGNLHGSVSLGAGLVCLRGLTLLWERRRALAHGVGAWWRPMALVAGGPLCLLLTPYGGSIISYYSATLFNTALKHAVTEWQPITSAPFIAGPFFVLAGVALWSFGRYARRTTLWERAGLIVLGIGAIDAVRNVSFFALAAVIVVGLSIDAAVVARVSGRVRLRPRLNRVLAGSGMLIVVVAAVATVGRDAPSFEQPRLQRVLEVVSSTAAADPSLRLISDQKAADWLLWRDPSLRGRMAFDVRFELLSVETLRRLQRLYLAAGPAWQREARGYRLLILDSKDDPLSTKAFLTEPGRRVLYDDGRNVVILRSAASASSAA